MQMKQWKLVKYNLFVKFTLPSCEVLYILLPLHFWGQTLYFSYFAESDY